MGQLELVGCAIWQPRPDFNSEPVLRDAGALLIPPDFVVSDRFELDEQIAAQNTFREPQPAGPPILRLRVRAPVVAGVDLPMAQWQADALDALLDKLGLDRRLRKAGVDPMGLRRLRFRGVQAPFLMLADDDQIRGFATLTLLPMAGNVLVEIEHGRVWVDDAPALDPLSFHEMDAHTVWSASLGDAPGLAPALGLRALTTIDRGLRALARRATTLEVGIATTVTSGVLGPEDELRARELTRELLAATGLTGAVAGRLTASRDLGPGERGRMTWRAAQSRPASRDEHPYDRFIGELERLTAAVAERRDDLRAVARTAADAAGMLGLMEQQLQARRTATLQRTITLIATIVLLPGLVASIYGANIAVPGRDNWAGTVVLVAGMLAIGILSVWLLRALDRERPDSGWLRPARQRWLLLSALAALVASGLVAVLNA